MEAVGLLEILAWGTLFLHKQKTTVCTSTKAIREILERGKINTPITQIHDRPLSWLSTGTSIKSGRVIIV